MYRHVLIMSLKYKEKKKKGTGTALLEIEADRMPLFGFQTYQTDSLNKGSNTWPCEYQPQT